MQRASLLKSDARDERASGDKWERRKEGLSSRDENNTSQGVNLRRPGPLMESLKISCKTLRESHDV